MYNNAIISNDPVHLRQFSSGNSKKNPFGEKFTSYCRTSMSASNLLMRKKEKITTIITKIKSYMQNPSS